MQRICEPFMTGDIKTEVHCILQRSEKFKNIQNTYFDTFASLLLGF